MYSYYLINSLDLKEIPMAKIVEELIAIRVSSLYRDNSEPENPLFTEEVIAALENVISDLVGKGAIVEIIKE